MKPNEMNLVSWMREIALPFWASRGVDRKLGGFIEQLAQDGTPSDPGFKRVRVQGRQLYSFSLAAILNWHPQSREIADHGFDFLKRTCRGADGYWVRRLKTDGSILDMEMDLYDTSFIALGLSTYYRLTQNSEALQLLGMTLDQVKSRLSVPGGRGYWQSQGEKGILRQNPHMHWFEAMLYCFEATQDKRFLEEAGKVYQIAKDFVIDPSTGALRELFDGTWKPALEDGKILVEPGHHCEWAWLLWKAAKVLTVDPELSQIILKFSDQHGVDNPTGLVFDQVSDKGELTQATHRLWVQTEALKAWLIRSDAKDEERQSHVGQIEANLLRYYLAREPMGSWGDRLNADKSMQSGPVPASSMYHIMTCVTELASWRSQNGTQSK
jgi:mannose/cellobiose epimerase-like protein (N-acyl-D-glucosamine 2-epimerase family)